VSWYKEYKDQWKEIIEIVAAEEHRTTLMIEKDTIQSMVLLGLSKSEISFVFKGGTSISKCYGLIDRFSEDIDLSMNCRPTESEKRKAIESRFYESDYNSITKRLLYEDVSYDDAIEKGIAKVAEMDIFTYRKK